VRKRAKDGKYADFLPSRLCVLLTSWLRLVTPFVALRLRLLTAEVASLGQSTAALSRRPFSARSTGVLRSCEKEGA